MNTKGKPTIKTLKKWHQDSHEENPEQKNNMKTNDTENIPLVPELSKEELLKMELEAIKSADEQIKVLKAELEG